jgi:hypothetical protein
MSWRLTLAIILIGAAAISTGFVGVLLPSGERLAAALALVVGAGVGVVALAIGDHLVTDTPAGYESLFLTSAALGFAASAMSLGVLWRRCSSAV